MSPAAALGTGLVVGLLLGAAVVAALARLLHRAAAASLGTERDLLRERVVDLEASLAEDAQTAAVLAPLRDALGRVEQQVGTLERDRATQLGRIGGQLASVADSTEELRRQTASLASSLQASNVRGVWGEAQLRRVLEHSGMLPRCDFDEQVSAVTRHDRAVRPDVVVRLPGEKVLVIDAKVPLTAYLEAHAEEVADDERARLLAAHARALRGHVDALAAKAYWTAFVHTPEMVVCFVPSDAILAAAVAAEPALFDRALGARVVLASPGTLLALLRTVAYTWQQDALTEGARQLLVLGQQLYARLGGVAKHATAMGRSLQRSVESYNALVGTLESRVLATARSMHRLGLAEAPPSGIAPLEVAPRPLTAAELFDALGPDIARPELDQRELDRRELGRSDLRPARASREVADSA